MKKNLFVLSAGLAMVLGSCSQSELTETQESSRQIPVLVSSYVPQSTMTRAGYEGTMTDETLQNQGFGLFAFYSDASTYNGSTEPNFMYNQKVSVSDENENWTYSPLKYWPNETANGVVDGKSDKGGATSEGGADCLTFFAYAPYVDVTDLENGTVKGTEYGITKITGNATTGDPKVTYKVATDPAESVDLLWAVVKDGTTTWSNVTGTDVNLTPGLPYLNLIKPSVSQTVDLYFRHALTKLNLKIQGAFDKVDLGGTKDDATKITVESVEITGFGGGTDGVLNLNNTDADTPLWTDVSGTVDVTLDSKNMNKDIADPASFEKFAELPAGVTATAQNLFQTESEDDDVAYMFIPSSKEGDVTVTITYYVTTEDANLKAGYSRIKNVITKKISKFTAEAGKSYTLLLGIGMTSVKLTATVANWEDVEDATQIDLPINVEQTNNDK